MMAAVRKSHEDEEAGTSAGERFSAEERAAMKERAAELAVEKRRGRGAGRAAADERSVLAKIAEMPEPDRALAERVHAIVTAAAPELSSKLWYGMPAYARDGKVVCFFRSGQMDKTRYSVFGFNDEARLDEGGMWPTAYALTELSDDAEARIGALVAKAVR